VEDKGRSDDETQSKAEAQQQAFWSWNAWLRQHVKAVVTSSIFEGLILLVILWSSTCLAMDNPRDDSESTKAHVKRSCGLPLETSWLLLIRCMSLQVLYWMDSCISIIFIIEAALRIYALGVYREEDAYFRNSWNWLDFVVTVVGFCCLCAALLPLVLLL
jgi:hypothetical protein